MTETWLWAVGLLIGILLAQRLLWLIFRRGVRSDAPASRIVIAAELFSCFLVTAVQVDGCVKGEDLAEDLKCVAMFGAAAVVAFEVAGRLGMRLLLRAKLDDELHAGNVAAATVGAAYIGATGIVAASCLYGTDVRTLGISLLSFVVAQLVLHGLVAFFRMLTSYDDTEEILDANMAAALSHAGLTVALGMVVGHAIEGEFVDLRTSAEHFGVALGVGLLLYPIRQILIQFLVLREPPTLRGGPLDRAIAQDRDVGIGVIEALTYIGTAIVVDTLA